MFTETVALKVNVEEKTELEMTELSKKYDELADLAKKNIEKK